MPFRVTGLCYFECVKFRVYWHVLPSAFVSWLFYLSMLVFCFTPNKFINWLILSFQSFWVVSKPSLSTMQPSPAHGCIEHPAFIGERHLSVGSTRDHEL